MKLFTPAHPNPASPVPSCKNHSKGSCLVSPCPSASWPTLVLPRVTLRGVLYPLLLGTVSDQPSFQYWSSPDPLASPHTWIIIKPTLYPFFLPSLPPPLPPSLPSFLPRSFFLLFYFYITIYPFYFGHTMHSTILKWSQKEKSNV